MAARLVVGTIRARRGERHDVVLPDGRCVAVRFDGDAAPAIGADVVGLFDPEAPGTNTLTLVADVTRLIMAGRARIVTSGRSDVTARMLARMSEGTGLGAIAPGMGGIIERTPDVEDPDLGWALSRLAPEARRLGLGLNVIDPLALARSPWEDRRLTEDLLPADDSGDLGALSDLKALMAEGFAPGCRRTLFGLARGTQVPSVDFVLPYSPFATGHSFSAGLAGARKGELPRLVLPGSDARRLSAFRETVRAFAPRVLGRQRGNPLVAAQVEAVFADVAAALAFLSDGGSPSTVRTLAALRREGFRRSPGAPASHVALQTVLSVGAAMRGDKPEALLRNAASLAKAHVPAGEGQLAESRAALADDGLVYDVSRLGAADREVLERRYAEDLEDTVARLGDTPRALARLGRFALKTVPLGLDATFEEVLDRMGAPLDAPEPDDPLQARFGGAWGMDGPPA